MGHFAELNEDNVVLRVVTACNQDIANNGGEQSEQAAKYFETICPLSNEGVKWIQTSYNKNFRKNFAGPGMTYDENKNKFIEQRPFPSWNLDSNDNWKAPYDFPSNMLVNGVETVFNIIWDESIVQWRGFDINNNQYIWSPSSLSWSSI